MKDNLVIVGILFLLFVSVFSMSSKVHTAHAQTGTIYIRADGSVDPSDAPVVTSDNVTYTLQSSVNASVIIERSNIILNGQGHEIRGSGILNATGIDITDRTNVTVKNVQVTRFTYGINLLRSSDCVVKQNNVTNNDNGIKLSSSYGNMITENKVNGSDNGIIMNLVSNFNSVTGNLIMNNTYAVRLEFGPNQNNSFLTNTVAKNQYAFVVLSSSLNTIYHNDFLNNTFPAFVDNSSLQNLWDNGYPSGGNHWSNYNGSDANMNGIGDTAFTITRNATDNYPLMGTFHVFNAYQSNYVTVVSNSTIDSFSYVQSNSTILIRASNSTVDQIFGFCRVSIPHALMSGPYNVTVDGASPYYVNYTMYDNGTDRWIYLSYQHSTREIVVVAEFQPLILMSASTVTTLLAVALWRGRRNNQR